jgi:tRNA(fMet)-specific endonuclease VapC
MILDTNALSAWADGDPACRDAFLSAKRLVLPVIVLGEYLFGIRQSKFRSRYDEWLAKNLPMVEIHQVTPNTSGIYADARLWLKFNGTPIPSNDLWIAAMTLEHRLPLLSNDTHFDRVPGVQRIPF